MNFLYLTVSLSRSFFHFVAYFKTINHFSKDSVHVSKKRVWFGLFPHPLPSLLVL